MLVLASCKPVTAASKLTLNLSKPAAARAFLEKSTTPTAQGTEDCQVFAATFPTLGALAVAHRRRANVESSVRCRRTPPGWSCEASYIYNDKKESENDWALVVRFKVDQKSAKIVEFACFGAG